MFQPVNLGILDKTVETDVWSHIMDLCVIQNATVVTKTVIMSTGVDNRRQVLFLKN